jgi:hypothetical protein
MGLGRRGARGAAGLIWANKRSCCVVLMETNLKRVNSQFITRGKHPERASILMVCFNRKLKVPIVKLDRVTLVGWVEIKACLLIPYLRRLEGPKQSYKPGAIGYSKQFEGFGLSLILVSKPSPSPCRLSSKVWANIIDSRQKKWEFAHLHCILVLFATRRM